MTIKEIFEDYEFEKPNLKPFDTVVKESPRGMMSFGKNGYVVVPDKMPLDYFNSYYGFLDDSAVGGLTFGGYLTVTDGKIRVLYLDSPSSGHEDKLSKEDHKFIDKIKPYCVRAVGFDNNHYMPNIMDAQEGVKYLSKQLKQHYLEESND